MEVQEALERLRGKDHKEVAKRCEVAFLPPKEGAGARYLVNVLDLSYCIHLDRGVAEEVVTEDQADAGLTRLVLKYLIFQCSTEQEKGWIGIDRFAGAAQHHGDFVRRVMRPFLEHFGYNRQLFESASKQIGGTSEKLGGVAFSFRFLPKLFALVQLWPGDERALRKPSANIMFSAHSVKIWDGKDAVSAAEFLVKRLRGTRRPRRRSPVTQP
ncbi:MAG: DUF3786 domain-containing protein [Thaumarchaeota archaeon]|nr:DUF3786 domain-containing protein [Candidatus Calditenuaceae archaeon]MDW8041880.1 DUF3786 domain-containing protein [Nitrososphaerota archaeon]